jgi:hypothetical protein
MGRSVSIYERKGKVLVIPVFQIEGGGYVEKHPVHLIGTGNWRAVGEAVLQALAAYEEGLPMPDWNQYSPVGRNEIGARSEDEFEQDLKGCALETGNTEIAVTPYETRSGRGLVPLAEEEFRVPLTADPQILGEIVREGLSRARIAAKKGPSGESIEE